MRPTGHRASQSQSWTFDSGTGRLTSTTNGFSEDASFTYDSLGRLATKTFEGNNYEVYTYDSRGRLTNIKHRKPTHEVTREYTYTYDDSGKVLTYKVGTLTTTYAYDGAGQLTSESRTGYSATYSYDANGNRLTRTVGGTTENYAYDDGDKLEDVKVGGTAIKTFGYDAAGRTTSVTTSAGTTTIGYDFESRATSISGPGVSQTNVYNGLDTRVSSTTNSVLNTFLRDGAYVTDPVVKDSNATYTPGLYERRAGSTRQLHHNLKSVEAQTTLTPAISAGRTYDAFGNILGGTGTHLGPFGYGGGFGYQEDATGLKLLGHRLYDSSTGRFLTRDPIKDGRNWYVYCENDPVSGVDPAGLALIYIGWREVLGGGHHAYLVIVDEATGETWTIGGGPQNETGAPGKLINNSGKGGEGNYEGIGRGIPSAGNHRQIKDDDRPGKWWFDKLNSIGIEIHNQGLGYGALDQVAMLGGLILQLWLGGSNSNAFVTTVIHRGGLADDVQWASIPLDGWTYAREQKFAPGWGRVIPR